MTEEYSNKSTSELVAAAEERGVSFSNTEQRALILRDYEAKMGYKEEICCGGLWEELTLIDEEVDKNRHMTWSELFYDLIFVTAVARIGDEMKSGKFDASVYTLYMVTVFGFWHSATCFGCRYHRGDLSQKIFFALHMMGMTAILMCLPNSWWSPSKVCHYPHGVYSEAVYDKCVEDIAPHMPTFCFCVAIIHAIEITGHARVWYRYCRRPMAWYEKETNSRMMRQSIKRQVEHIVPFCTWISLGMGWIPGHYFVYGFMLDLILRSDNFLVWWLMRVVQKVTCIPDSWFEYWAMMPLHVEHYTERLGLVVLIVLGESVDGIAVAGTFTVSLCTMVLLAYLVIFGMKLLYFDCMIMEGEEHLLFASSHKEVISEDASITKEEALKHPLVDAGVRKERVLCPHLRGSTWIMSHQFLASSVAMMGDALAVLAKHEHEENEVARGKMKHIVDSGMSVIDARQVLCVSVGANLLMIAYIGLTHEQENLHPKNPHRHVFAFLYYLQLGTIMVFGIASILLQYVDQQQLSNMHLIVFFAASTIIISVLFYVDECKAFSLLGGEEEAPLLTPAVDVDIDSMIDALSSFDSASARHVVDDLKKSKQTGSTVSSKELASMIAAISSSEALPANASFKSKGTCCF